MSEIIHRGETMLISISAEDFPITAYGWWSWNCPAGAHIKITGYNRTT